MSWQNLVLFVCSKFNYKNHEKFLEIVTFLLINSKGYFCIGARITSASERGLGSLLWMQKRPALSRTRKGDKNQSKATAIWIRKIKARSGDKEKMRRKSLLDTSWEQDQRHVTGQRDDLRVRTLRSAWNRSGYRRTIWRVSITCIGSKRRRLRCHESTHKLRCENSEMTVG